MGGVSDFQNVLKIKKFPIILGGGGKFKLGKVPKFSRFHILMASLSSFFLDLGKVKEGSRRVHNDHQVSIQVIEGP